MVFEVVRIPFEAVLETESRLLKVTGPEAFLRRAGLCFPPLVYAITEKASGSLIGQLIWHPWDESSMELGWILRRDRWGRGLAKELTEAMLRQSDRDVVLECVQEQTATKHIAERFGFTLEEEGTLLRYRKT